ncbi:MAG: DNA-3-methyladenine glycosylase [Dehalococcoidia bacterium]
MTTFSVDAALAHLREVDAQLAAIMDRVGDYNPTIRRVDPYASLLRTILFQQLAGAAANAIQRRFLALYGDDGQPPAPEQLLATSDEDLRGAGISRQKISYMRDLALHVHEGRLDLDELVHLEDEEVVRRITAVKGLGEWSAHMYLMFHLGRPDVLPVGDLGVRNGMRITYALEVTPTPKQALEIGARWAPYRSVGSWYMWRAGEPVAPDI